MQAYLLRHPPEERWPSRYPFFRKREMTPNTAVIYLTEEAAKRANPTGYYILVPVTIPEVTD